MTIVNVGSIHRDFVFQVSLCPNAGETIQAQNIQRGLDGKGLNQSVAIARASGAAIPDGVVGSDDHALQDEIDGLGVASNAISESFTCSTGRADVCVDCHGDNAVVISIGEKADIPDALLTEILAHADTTDWLLFQHEVYQ